MDDTRHHELGQRFAELHRDGIFLLANVGDAGTARALGDAGVDAVATSSAAHATTIGRADAAGAVSLDEHADHTAVIVDATSVPVNVDAENGYGHRPEDMARAVARFAAVGAAGMGVEDWDGNGALYDRALAVERIAAAVEAAQAVGRPFVITGRTEVLLYGLDGGLDEALARLQGFASVGADCLYAPGTWDLATVAAVVDGAGGPVNVLVPVGSRLRIDDLGAVGVRRVSLGSSLYTAQVAHGVAVVERIRATGGFSSP